MAQCSSRLDGGVVWEADLGCQTVHVQIPFPGQEVSRLWFALRSYKSITALPGW